MILEDEKEKKRIEPLPPVDHSLIQYPPFKKRFYKESAEICALTESEVQSIRKELQVSVSMSASAAIASGFADCPKPIQARCITFMLKIDMIQTPSNYQLKYIVGVLSS